MMSPLSGLLHSRKFLLLLLDTVVSLATYFVGKYAAPGLANDINFLIAAYQPVFVSIIVAIAVEDAAAKRANGGSLPKPD